MQHLGDITKISGGSVPAVDCVIGGSPCQDLSVAGKRAGLVGERSGLFMEQIRVIKEMREHDKANGRASKSIRPRFMVWENVCFTAGTLITTEYGYKSIEDVQIGDKVKTHSGRYMPVINAYKTSRQEIIQITASGSEPIRCTLNHPFLIKKKNNS